VVFILGFRFLSYSFLSSRARVRTVFWSGRHSNNRCVSGGEKRPSKEDILELKWQFMSAWQQFSDDLRAANASLPVSGMGDIVSLRREYSTPQKC
jgi:hypothetical protein